MAQNMVLSQPYVNAQFQNPALVGDGIYDQRIQSNLRTQMFANNNVSNTIVGSWDSRFKNNDIDNINFFGYGLQLMSDQLAGGLLQTNYMTMNLSYRIYINDQEENSIALGLAGTYAQTFLNQSKLVLGDQLYSQMMNLSSISGLPVTQLSFNKFPHSFTANAGFVFKHHSEKSYIQAGIGAFNTVPNVVTDIGQESAGLRGAVFINAEQLLEDDKTYVLHASYSNRSNNATINQQIIFGGSLGLPIAYKAETLRRLYLGCYYRLKEAFIPTISFMMDGNVFGISYDVYNNDITGASIKQNSFELSFSKSFGKKRNEWMRTIFD
ncbi:MAG: hypothetical protein WCL56_12645 [Sediminibacterium sp.]